MGRVKFSIVTDSEFGDLPDGGAVLLKRLLSDTEIGDQLEYGVIYSSLPNGNAIPGKIVKLTQRPHSTATDAHMIIDLLRTGELGSGRQILSIMNSLQFLKFCDCAKVLEDPDPKTSRIFRPVTTYGQGNFDDEGEYFCDPILAGLGDKRLHPFSIASCRLFDPEVFVTFEEHFDLENAEEARIVNSCISALCPIESVKAAILSAPADLKFDRGALRLLWDLTMTGECSRILRTEIHGNLKNLARFPQEFERNWERYIKIFDEFCIHDNRVGVFEALWRSAMLELDVLRDASKLFFQRTANGNGRV